MNNIVLSGGVNYLEKFASTAKINVKGNSILNAINIGKDLDLKIKLLDDASLVLNLFDFAEDLCINLDIESLERSKIVVNVSFIAEGNYTLNIDNKLYGSDIETDVNIRGINEENGNVKIIMNGTVAGETKNNVLNEYAKVINKSENSNILIPNLIINTNEVIANHGVSIGGFNEEELFYLTSKGIDRTSAKKIIEEGFILSIMDEKINEKIKSLLIGR